LDESGKVPVLPDVVGHDTQLQTATAGRRLDVLAGPKGSNRRKGSEAREEIAPVHEGSLLRRSRSAKQIFVPIRVWRPTIRSLGPVRQFHGSADDRARFLPASSPDFTVRPFPTIDPWHSQPSGSRCDGTPRRGARMSSRRRDFFKRIGLFLTGAWASPPCPRRAVQ